MICFVINLRLPPFINKVAPVNSKRRVLMLQTGQSSPGRDPQTVPLTGLRPAMQAILEDLVVRDPQRMFPELHGGLGELMSAPITDHRMTARKLEALSHTARSFGMEETAASLQALAGTSTQLRAVCEEALTSLDAVRDNPVSRGLHVRLETLIALEQLGKVEGTQAWMIADAFREMAKTSRQAGFTELTTLLERAESRFQNQSGFDKGI